MMIHCKKVLQLIPLHKEGFLPPDLEEDLAAHLLSCSSCAKFDQGFREILNHAKDERVSEADPFFYTRLEAKMTEREEIPTLSQLRLRPIFLGISILLPLIAGILLGISFRPEKEAVEQQNITLVAEVNNFLSTPGFSGQDE
jgi:hypothetical protein